MEKYREHHERGPEGAQTMMSAMSRIKSISELIPFAEYPSSFEMSISFRLAILLCTLFFKE